MKGLISKSPHVENILSGKKTWEIRGSNTRIRGEIALIKSGSGTIVVSISIGILPVFLKNSIRFYQYKYLTHCIYII